MSKRENNFRVFTFTDDAGAVFYAGIGKSDTADKLWKHRNRERSPLNDVLSNFAAPPTLTVLGRNLTESGAEDLLAVVRSRLLAEGAELLSTRPIDSFRTGGGVSMAVVVDGFWFKSIREAARVLEVNASTIQRRIRAGKDAYRA